MATKTDEFGGVQVTDEFGGVAVAPPPAAPAPTGQPVTPSAPQTPVAANPVAPAPQTAAQRVSDGLPMITAQTKRQEAGLDVPDPRLVDEQRQRYQIDPQFQTGEERPTPIAPEIERRRKVALPEAQKRYQAKKAEIEAFDPHIPANWDQEFWKETIAERKAKAIENEWRMLNEDPEAYAQGKTDAAASPAASVAARGNRMKQVPAVARIGVDVASGFASGSAGLYAGLRDTYADVHDLDSAFRSLVGSGGSFDPEKRAKENAFEEATKATRDFEARTAPDTLPGQVAAVGPYLAAGMLPGGQAAIALSMYGTGSRTIRERAAQAGLSQEEAFVASKFGGALYAAAAMLPYHRALNVIQGGEQNIIRYAKDHFLQTLARNPKAPAAEAAKSALSFAFMVAAQESVVTLASGEPMTPGKAWEIITSAIESMPVGAVIGAGTSAAGMRNAGITPKPRPQEQPAEPIKPAYTPQGRKYGLSPDEGVVPPTEIPGATFELPPRESQTRQEAPQAVQQPAAEGKAEASRVAIAKKVNIEDIEVKLAGDNDIAPGLAGEAGMLPEVSIDANGKFQFKERNDVVVWNGLSPSERQKTIGHELGHRMHQRAQRAKQDIPQTGREADELRHFEDANASRADRNISQGKLKAEHKADFVRREGIADALGAWLADRSGFNEAFPALGKFFEGNFEWRDISKAGKEQKSPAAEPAPPAAPQAPAPAKGKKKPISPTGETAKTGETAQPTVIDASAEMVHPDTGLPYTNAVRRLQGKLNAKDFSAKDYVSSEGDKQATFDAATYLLRMDDAGRAKGAPSQLSGTLRSRLEAIKKAATKAGHNIDQREPAASETAQRDTTVPPVQTEKPVRIVRSAVRMSNGEVLEGADYDAGWRGGSTFKPREGESADPQANPDKYSHASILKSVPKDRIAGAEAGFITSDGRFVGRKQAFDIAEKAGQVKSDGGPRQLHSEALWADMPKGGEPAKSKGHVAAIDGVEYFKDDQGVLYRVDPSNPIEVGTGYRSGSRFEAPSHLADMRIKMLRGDIKDTSVPMPVSSDTKPVWLYSAEQWLGSEPSRKRRGELLDQWKGDVYSALKRGDAVPDAIVKEYLGYSKTKMPKSRENDYRHILEPAELEKPPPDKPPGGGKPSESPPSPSKPSPEVPPKETKAKATALDKQIAALEKDIARLERLQDKATGSKVKAYDKAISDKEALRDRLVDQRLQGISTTPQKPSDKPGDINPGNKISLAESETLANEQGAFTLEQAVGAVGRVVGAVARGAESVGNAIFGEMGRDLRRSKAGRGLVVGLDSVASKAASLEGRVANQIADGYKQLSAADRKFLGQIDQYGYTNFQRMVEDTPSGRLRPQNQAQKAMVDAYSTMLKETADEAVRVGVKRIDSAGNVVDFTPATSGRYLRAFTPDAMQAIVKGSGPMFEALARAVEQQNPGMTLVEAKDTLREFLGPEAVRKQGSIEKVRTIQNLPSFVDVGGSWKPVLETDPYMAATGAARSLAKRIYFIEQFGQNINGRKTAVERLRARWVRDGGDESTFNDVLDVFHNRPYGRWFNNPRSVAARTVRTADQFVKVAQTSLSALVNIPQTAVQVPRYTGPVNYARAVIRTLLHPRQTAAQLAGMGAMSRSVMDWSVRKGNVPEDLARIFRGVVGRVTGLHWIAEANNMIAGEAFRGMAEHWANHGIEAGDIRVAKELRLTPKEIADVRAGRMTDAIKNKIVQNGVKITQYVTEDTHRRSKFQNIPILNSIFDYNNYAIGTAKSTGRMIADIGSAIASKDPAKMLAAGKRLSLLVVGSVGAGILSLAMRRKAKGLDSFPEDEDWKDRIGRATMEIQLMGPTQRIVDAGTFSGNSAEKYLAALSPKVSLIADAIEVLAGKGNYARFPVEERAKRAIVQGVPIVKAGSNWVEKLTYPDVTEYDQARRMVSAFKKENVFRRSQPGDFEYNPDTKPIRDAIRHHDIDAAIEAAKKYIESAKAKGKDDKSAISGLKTSLRAARPFGDLSADSIEKMLSAMKPERRDALRATQAKFVALIESIISAVAPKGSGKPKPPRPTLPPRP